MGVLVPIFGFLATFRRPRRDSNARPFAPQIEALLFNTPYMSKNCHYLEPAPTSGPLTPINPKIIET